MGVAWRKGTADREQESEEGQEATGLGRADALHGRVAGVAIAAHPALAATVPAEGQQVSALPKVSASPQPDSHRVRAASGGRQQEWR
jgi:hypothetical protein